MENEIENSEEIQSEEIECEKEDDRFKEDPEVSYRIYSIISYFVVLIIIGMPVWWQTTRVYRATLPIDQMFNVEIPNKTVRQNSIPLSLEYDVLITIVHPDPYLKVDLDAKDIVTNLEPLLNEIKTIADFTFKSQWLYMVELGVIPKNEKDYLAVYNEQLPHIITPLEKKIWSHMSLRPSLNLVLYVAHCHKPLYIFNKDKSRAESNAFLNPRWGGVTIINADKEACDKREYTPDLKPIIQTFMAQLRELLGFSKENVESLKEVKAREMIDSTRRTLKSLAQLLSEISSIVISDEVAHKIQVALENADKGDAFLKIKSIDKALHAAKIAYKNSEEAFSDPSLLALLYFPDDQKYAIYIPLFLPIMIPVFMSLMTLKKYYNIKNGDKLKEE